jgi:hypothetical protein
MPRAGYQRGRTTKTAVVGHDSTLALILDTVNFGTGAREALTQLVVTR